MISSIQITDDCLQRPKAVLSSVFSPLSSVAAALTFEIAPSDGEGQTKAAPLHIRVIPDGEFDALDGRPGNIEGVKAKKWRMDATIAEAVITRFTAYGVDLPIDYEHQTLHTAANGRPAPAAGWMRGLEYVSGTGLVAHVRWTDAAAAHLAAGEYRYLSPIFFFDPDTGAVLCLHSLALTNKPALGRLGEIAALVNHSAKSETHLLAGKASRLAKPVPFLEKKQENPIFASDPRLKQSRVSLCDKFSFNEESTMDKTKFLVALGLPLDTGDDTAFAQLSALVRKSKELETQVAAMKANQFDPARHIPLAEHAKITGELAALKAESEKVEHARLIEAALSDARILPPNEAYWRAQPLAALQAFLKDAKPLAALQGTQTGGLPPDGGGKKVALSDDEMAVAKSLGLSPEEFSKAKNECGVDESI
ncbi:MAG: phage protease [Candidatus Accumulibacter sp.]|jgi:phage I-like protein|nr:phage protease [Accumulibacter sp.]